MTDKPGHQTLFTLAKDLSGYVDPRALAPAPATTTIRLLDHATSQELTQFLAGAIRDAASSITDGSVTNPQFREYLTTYAASADGNPRISRARRNAELAAIDAMAPFIQETVETFGLQLKNRWTYHNMATAAVAAIVETLDEPALDTQSDGWTKLGRICLALLAVATEPQPTRTHTAKPAQWLILPTL